MLLRLFFDFPRSIFFILLSSYSPPPHSSSVASLCVSFVPSLNFSVPLAYLTVRLHSVFISPPILLPSFSFFLRYFSVPSALLLHSFPASSLLSFCAHSMLLRHSFRAPILILRYLSISSPFLLLSFGPFSVLVPFVFPFHSFGAPVSTPHPSLAV